MALTVGGRARRFAWSSAVAAGVAFVLIACGAVKQRGELMLAMQTDLELPKDVDSVRIEVTSFGKTLFAQDYPVGPDGVKIPATLGVVGDPSSPSTPVEVRVIASQSGTLRVLRNVTTTVPADRTAILRMPLAWLCWNQVTTDSTNTAQSSCPTGQTCVAGECTSNLVNSDDLKDFDPAAVFGGSGDATGGACFDTVACFAQGFVAAVDDTDCSILKPAASGAGINVGMIRNLGSAGICGSEACYVPLDEDPTEGWVDAGDKIMLPPAVCNRLTAPATPKLAIAGVVVTTSCPTKTSSTPTCGPWSSVGGGEGTFDAGTPTGFVSTAFAGTWTAEGLNGLESCGGESYSTTLTISQDNNGNYSVDEEDGPVLTVDESCQSVSQTGLPATLNADGTLTFTPSLAQFCSCSSSALDVTLSITPEGALNASLAFSGVTECPAVGSTKTGTPDAATPPSDGGLAVDSGAGVGEQGVPFGGEADAGSGSGGGPYCSDCSNVVSCTVDLTFIREGTGNSTDAGVFFDASAPPDAGEGFGFDGGAGSDASTGTQSCSPVNCSGCCDIDGICQAGFSPSACGEGGDSCQNCSALGGTCNALAQCVQAGKDGGPVDGG
jgi:hypothetical protein